MEIIVKIYSCYSLTYSRVYKDIVKRLYGSNVDFNNVKLEVEDISQNGTLSIQSQRSKSSYVTRTVRICTPIFLGLIRIATPYTVSGRVIIRSGADRA